MTLKLKLLGHEIKTHNIKDDFNQLHQKYRNYSVLLDYLVINYVIHVILYFVFRNLT